LIASPFLDVLGVPQVVNLRPLALFPIHIAPVCQSCFQKLTRTALTRILQDLFNVTPAQVEASVETDITILANIDLPAQGLSCLIGADEIPATVAGKTAICKTKVTTPRLTTVKLVFGNSNGREWAAKSLPLTFFSTTIPLSLLGLVPN